MPISHAHRAIFIHIPKTAGTSVEAALGMHGEKTDIGITPYPNQVPDQGHLYGGGLQHLTAEQLKATLGDDALFSRYFKFAIVRNPWDRLVSTCAWADQKWAKGQHLTPAQFDQAVRQIYALYLAAQSWSHPSLASPHLKPQSLYILNDDQSPAVDYVARYESLEADWRHICEHLGVDAALPIRMKSHHRPYQDYYSDQTRAAVAQMYAQDASAFGYDF
jgi:Sulfotransferase family